MQPGCYCFCTWKKNRRSLFFLVELLPGLLWTNAQALLETRHQFILVQLFSFPRGFQFILSADQNPYFFSIGKKPSACLLEAQKRKGQYAHLDLPDTNQVSPGAPEQESNLIPGCNSSERKHSESENGHPLPEPGKKKWDIADCQGA